MVLHYTAMNSAEAARDWLCNPTAEVSAHYVIARNGTCWQLVDEADRAWHAGAGSWGGCCDVNSASIGIELDNTGFEPFAEPQMAALENLLRGILGRWSIPPEGVIGHSDLAPGRKIDPGRRFDWQRLSRQGLAAGHGLHVARGLRDREVPFEKLRPALTRIGYTWDAAPEQLLAAFRHRHLPFLDGPPTEADVAVAEHLAQGGPQAGIA